MARNPLPEDLGNIDATYDDLLNEDTFVQTACYGKVLDDKNYIIVGRKGVGKTALARMIPSRECNNPSWKAICLASTPNVHFSDLAESLETHDTLKNISSPDFFYQLWEHFILTNCMKLIVRTCGKSPYTGVFATMYEYLKGIGQADLDFVSTVARLCTSLVECVAPSLSLGIVNLKVGSGDRIRTIFDRQHNYGAAVSALRDALRSETFRILYLIDGIDENIMKDSSPDVVFHFVSQLLALARDVNYGSTTAHLPNFARHITVKAFIPTDIYSWLEMRHADKFRQYKYELTWTHDELREMFRRRLSEICRLGNMPFENVLHKYFGGSIYDTFGNRRDVFTYVVDHTFGRPRDIMNLYRELKSLLAPEQKISVAAAYKAIAEYISLTIDTIIDEYKFVRPDLDEILLKFDKSNSILTYDDILFAVASKEIVALNLNEVHRVIHMLYEIGLFGILRYDSDASRISTHSKKTPLHSLLVEYCYDRRQRTLKGEYFVMHPIFRYEFSMVDNTDEFFSRIQAKV